MRVSGSLVAALFLFEGATGCMSSGGEPQEIEVVYCDPQAFSPQSCQNTGPSSPPRCNCSAATCQSPLDSCGESVCPGVCAEGESCQFCLDPDIEGYGCDVAEPCLASWCTLDPAGNAFCRPFECFASVLLPPLCGSPDAPCGEACCEPDCSSVECGEDPVCGTSCGECGAHHWCSINDCVQSPAYQYCEGDLSAMDPLIEIEPVAGAMPEPTGGAIADGIYDLIAEREYVHDSFAETYERGAMEFSAGATRVEHIYDQDLTSFADSETPHRLMTVSAEGTSLNFEVTCPDIAIFPTFTRPYSVQGSELWLFQEGLIEVYQRRQ